MGNFFCRCYPPAGWVGMIDLALGLIGVFYVFRWTALGIAHLARVRLTSTE